MPYTMNSREFNQHTNRAQKEALSQAAFAIYLNISKNQVSEWERGIKKPSGAALKLLSLVKAKGIQAIA